MDEILKHISTFTLGEIINTLPLEQAVEYFLDFFESENFKIANIIRDFMVKKFGLGLWHRTWENKVKNRII